jgi:hypothetical protein
LNGQGAIDHSVDEKHFAGLLISFTGFIDDVQVINNFIYNNYYIFAPTILKSRFLLKRKN